MKIFRFIKPLGLACVLICIGLVGTSSAIESSYRYYPPSIDGSVGWWEWDIANNIEFDHGFITVCNDETRLYILVDVLDDTVEDPRSSSSSGDHFVLMFDVDRNGEVTSADLKYELMTGTYNMRYKHCVPPGAVGIVPLSFSDYTRSSVAAGFGCFPGDFTEILYLPPLGPTCSNHRVWEFGIDLREIGAEAGGDVRMGLQIVSQNPSFTDDIPEGLSWDFTDLIEIELAAPPTHRETDESAFIFFNEEVELAIPSLGEPGSSMYGIELTQAIQDRTNSMPLVENKTTVARVYVGTQGVATPQPFIVYLYGSRDGDDLPGSPLSTLFMVPTMIDLERERLYDTANFLLPSSWTEGTVEFQARVFDLSGRLRESSTPLSRTFTPRDIPVYWVIPINVGTDDEPIVVSDERIDRPESYLKTVYPVPDVEFVRRDWSVIGAITSPVDPDEVDTPEERMEWGIHMNDIIEELREYYYSLEHAGSSSEYPFPDQIIGVIPRGGRADSDRESGGSGRVVAIDTRETGMAHEINHNMGNILADGATWGLHVSDPECIWDPERGWQPVPNSAWGCGADCGPDPEWPWTNDGIQEVGFDTRRPWVDGYEDFDYWTRFTVLQGQLRFRRSPVTGRNLATGFPDFMSYCKSALVNPETDTFNAFVFPRKWISPYRWERLFHFFTPPDDRLTPLEPRLGRGLGPILPVYYISGHVNKDGTGSLNPIFIQPGIPTKDIAPGDYVIEVQDASGKPLMTVPFPVSFVDKGIEHEEDMTPLELDVVQFHYQLPEQKGTSKIILKKGKQTLDVLKVSDNPPTVTVLKPKAGEEWGGGLQTIKWSAEDKDGDPLSFTIIYSPDKGKSWFPVAWNVQGESYKVDTSILPGGDAAMVRVIVTDGFNTAQDDSDGTFKVAGKPPAAFIILPEASIPFSSGEVIYFEGEATDLEDYSIPDASFIWSYDSTKEMGKNQNIGGHNPKVYREGNAKKGKSNYTTVFGTGRRVNARLPNWVQKVTLTVVDSEGNTGQDTVVIWAPTSDVSDNGVTDIRDIQLVVAGCGMTPNNHTWNPALDLNRDLVIDIRDTELVIHRWICTCFSPFRNRYIDRNIDRSFAHLQFVPRQIVTNPKQKTG